MDKKDKINTLIIDSLSPFNPELIYLFGSYVRDEMTLESDIDIAFFTLEKIDEVEVFYAAQKIGNSLGMNIDLVQLLESSTVFQKQVVSNGVCIYKNDLTKKHQFELLVNRKYLKLNEERAEILNSYDPLKISQELRGIS